MSGGSLDYICYKLDDVIDTVESRAKTALQKALVVCSTSVRWIHHLQNNA